MIDTLLLLALPASGKSEIRRYLELAGPDARADLGIGRPIHLDDYPYVVMMRRLDRTLGRTGERPVFFDHDDAPFRTPRDWLTLTVLLAEDDMALHEGRHAEGDPGLWMLARLAGARREAGLEPVFDDLEPEAAGRCADAIRSDASSVVWRGRRRRSDETVVIEFARGGPEGSKLPLPQPRGYAASLAMLGERILAGARILYVWVTPDQSRLKNRERSRPGGEGSILHHGVPDEVMRKEYGTDDLQWLAENSDRPGHIEVDAHGRTFWLPLSIFDNRTDLTSFLRGDPEDWPEVSVADLHSSLRRILSGE